MTVIYLGVGSNLGDRLGNLNTAIRMLSAFLAKVHRSSIYETPPWGYADQPAFLNCVIRAETQLSPVALLGKLKKIETQMGRVRSVRYGPRLIDLDILFYGDQVFRAEDLEIPHPRIIERAFVLVPLAEIAGNMRHPITRQTMKELVDSIDISGIVRQDPESRRTSE